MKKHLFFTAFLVITLFNVSLIAKTKPAPFVEIISTDPPCPAVLEPGQRLYVKVRYNAGDTESFRIWIRPSGSAPGCKSHPCRSITKKTGEYEGWFYFDDKAIAVNKIVVKIKDDKSEGYMLESTYPLKVEWKAPREKTVKQKVKPKPMDPFAVMQEEIEKKHAKKYEGIWTHTVTKPDGSKNAAIIKAVRNKNDSMNFSFLGNPFISAPIFRKHSIDRYRASIQFKLDNSEKALIYSLARKNDSLTGDLHVSWKDKPEKVTLRKLNLTQAISALEEQYIKNARLERIRKSDLRNIEKLKKQVTELEADLKKSNSETAKVKRSFARAQTFNKKQRQECQKMIKKHQELLAHMKEENKLLAERLGKSEKKAESYDNKNVQLMVKLEEAEKQIAEISALKINIQKLKKQNRALQQQKKKIHKELQESTRKRDQGNNEDGPQTTQEDSDTEASQGYWSG